MLKGVRILDFSRFMPGPYASQRLADLGAEVIKIEPPVIGDPLRSKDKGLPFSAINRNKKSVTINLKEPEGQRLAFQLGCKADVIIESFRPGIADAIGFGYEAVRRDNPGVIYCSLTGYGQSGLASRLGGHDLNYLALSGILAQLKDRAGKPIQPNIQFADLIGGIAAAEAILAALLKKALHSQGSYLDCAMTDALIGMMSVHTIIQSATGAGRGIEELNGRIIAYNIYETADGRFVSLAALENKFWENFCLAVGKEQWIGKQSTQAKSGNKTFFEVTSLFKSKNFEEWSKFSRDVDCCMTPVLETSEMMHSSYVVDKGLLTDVTTEDYGLLRQAINSAGGFQPKEPNYRNGQPPTLGQHNQEVFTSLLAATPEQIGYWQKRGII